MLVVLGAAVWPGGMPSNAMRRRVQAAICSGRGNADALYLVSGGVGKNPPSEAQVMLQLLLAEGIAQQQVLLDEQSGDTLESVRNCARIIQGLPDVSRVIICTDRYHILRTRWLFFLAGIRTAAGRIPSGWRQTGLRKWIYYCLREVPAIVQDTFLILAFRES